MSSDPTPYFSTSSKLVENFDGILVGVRRSPPAPRLLSWNKIRIFQVSPQGALLVRYARVDNMVGFDPLWYLMMSFGSRYPMEPSLVGAVDSDGESESGGLRGSRVAQ